MPTRFVNKASTAGGDGTTNDTAGATRAYASLQEALTEEGGALSGILEIICEGTTADGIATTSGAGFTGASASNYIHIKALSSASAGRHEGVWSTSKYRISGSAQFGYALHITVPFTRITGIQIENTHAVDGYSALRYEPGVTGASDDAYFDSLICRKATWNAEDHGYACQQRDGGATWRNCIGYRGAKYGLGVDFGPVGPARATVQNCVFAKNGEYGIRSNSGSNTVNVTNTYAGSNGVEDFSADITSLTTCHSEDATGNTTTAFSISTGARFTNITDDTEDFHIQSGSALIDVGTDLSGSFTTDVDGATRPGAWDVGADEFIPPPSAGGIVFNAQIG